MIKKRWRWPNLRRGSPQRFSLVIYIDMNFLCVKDYAYKENIFYGSLSDFRINIVMVVNDLRFFGSRVRFWGIPQAGVKSLYLYQVLDLEVKW